jgi:hypothetical protein
MAPKAFQRPPDPSTKCEDLAPIEQSIDAIILADSEHATVSKLHSGTVRTDRKMATPEELAEAKRIKIERRRASNLAAGSADCDGSYEEGLALTSEPRPAFQPPAESTTVRNDH